MSPYGLLTDGDISSYPRHISTTLIWHISTTLNPYIFASI
jgi:hypothetical protein